MGEDGLAVALDMLVEPDRSDFLLKQSAAAVATSRIITRSELMGALCA